MGSSWQRRWPALIRQTMPFSELAAQQPSAAPSPAPFAIRESAFAAPVSPFAAGHTLICHHFFPTSLTPLRTERQPVRSAMKISAPMRKAFSPEREIPCLWFYTSSLPGVRLLVEGTGILR